MRWRMLSTFPDYRVMLETATETFARNEERALALRLDPGSIESVSTARMLGFFDALEKFDGLLAVLLDGQYGAWALAIAAEADMVLASGETEFVLDHTGEEQAASAALSLARQAGKARAVQALVDGRVTIGSLEEWGIPVRLIESGQPGSAADFLEGLLGEAAMEAAIRLKRTWRLQASANREPRFEERLAVERLQFSKCFEEGVAERLAEFLRNRVGSSTEE